MLLYILKSSAILAILLLFYKVFLERENMHTFKRFYLLGTLLALCIIPFLTFVEYVEIPTVTPLMEQSTVHSLDVPSTLQEEMITDYIPAFLWSIYVMGIIVFGFKFFKNLSQIIQRIRKNPKLRINRITNVLLRDRIIPHTFFNYIFLNKHKFEAKEIPSEVLLHEETHAKQKHSLDVLLIEFIQVLFWFNPFIYTLKKLIKLNHEFLADREVLRKGVKPSKYQNILLEFSSNSFQPQLANAINYSSTRLTVFGKTFSFGLSAVGQVKKRFTVMKTQTSKKSIVLRSLLILPLFALLLFGFSEKKLVEIPSPVEITIPVTEQVTAVKTIEIRITKKGEILVQNKLLTSLDDLKSQLQKINTNLTKEQRENIVRVIIMPEAEPPMKLLKEIEAILIDYGVATIDVIGPEKFSNSKQQIKVQGGATKEQIEEYNALAKKYNAQPINERIIKKKELERLEYIYNIMTEKQKKKAVPFPECPPPPPPPTAPKIAEGKISATSPQPPTAPKISQGTVSNVTPVSPQAPKIANAVMSNLPPNAPVVMKGELSDIPPPPPPKSPMEHVVEMARKDALFYYEGKKISSEKAIALLKKDKKINIRTKHKGLKKPVVELSTKPFIIKK
ncbi:MAG: M56 family metallopeptidase [Maribacter sp.]|nr:M56 family metallopeptidase [Maribacter sp.]